MKIRDTACLDVCLLYKKRHLPGSPCRFGQTCYCPQNLTIKTDFTLKKGGWKFNSTLVLAVTTRVSISITMTCTGKHATPVSVECHLLVLGLLPLDNLKIFFKDAAFFNSAFILVEDAFKRRCYCSSSQNHTFVNNTYSYALKSHRYYLKKPPVVKNDQSWLHGKIQLCSSSLLLKMETLPQFCDLWSFQNHQTKNVPALPPKTVTFLSTDPMVISCKNVKYH